MTTPSIELRWGNGFEMPRQREIVRPYVKTAIELAKQGLEDYDLTLGSPKRVLVSNDVDLRGGGAMGKTCYLWFFQEEINEERINELWLAGIVFHELVHLIRQEHIAEKTNIEMAMTEGIAHMAGYDFETDILRQHGQKAKPDYSVEKAWAIPDRAINALERTFLESGAAQDHWGGGAYSEWFSSRQPYGVPKGVAIGINAVMKMENEGWDIADLIHLPAELIFDTV